MFEDKVDQVLRNPSFNTNLNTHILIPSSAEFYHPFPSYFMEICGIHQTLPIKTWWFANNGQVLWRVQQSGDP